MNIKENSEDTKKKKPPKKPVPKEDFKHIKGDIDDFIFFFSDNKRHSEK